MAFVKVILQLNIQPQYQAFVDEFLEKAFLIFSDTLHSMYMCGSIPKGKAVSDQSDADFTLIFHSTPSEYFPSAELVRGLNKDTEVEIGDVQA